MPAIHKLLLGLIATFLIGLIFYAGFGWGDRFITDLETRTNAALPSVPNSEAARISFDRSGVLYRQASGFAPGLDAKVKVALNSDLTGKVPGLFAVNWTDNAAPTAAVVVAAETGKPASVETVQDCQSQLDKAVTGRTIEFQSGTAQLTQSSTSLIDAVAAAMGPCAGTRIQIAGHTDPAGGTRRNQRLSEERANAVVEALMAKGIPGGRLQPIGFGETKPLDAGQTPEAYAKNRRIEFKVAAATPQAR